MNLFIDYDSVLNNMCHAWIDWINITHNRNYHLHDVDNWNWFRDLDIDAFKWFHDGVAFDLIDPLPGSGLFLDRMVMQYGASILTASSPQMIKHKDRHILKHFGEYEVHHHKEKQQFITGDGIHILVDDSPINCERWARRGGYAILFNYNGDYKYVGLENMYPNIWEVNSYEEVEVVINIIKEAQW